MIHQETDVRKFVGSNSQARNKRESSQKRLSEFLNDLKTLNGDQSLIVALEQTLSENKKLSRLQNKIAELEAQLEISSRHKKNL